MNTEQLEILLVPPVAASADQSPEQRAESNHDLRSPPIQPESMRRLVGATILLSVFFLPLLLFLFRSSAGSAQGLDNAGPSPLAGKWTYRSFRSDPSLSADPSSL